MKSRQFIYFFPSLSDLHSAIWGLTLLWTGLQWEALFYCITSPEMDLWNSNACDVSDLPVPSNADSCYVLFAWKQVRFPIRLWGCSDMLGLIRAFPKIPIDDVSVIGDGKSRPSEQVRWGQIQFEQAYSVELLFSWQTTSFYIRLRTWIYPSFILKFSTYFPMSFLIKIHLCILVFIKEVI